LSKTLQSDVTQRQYKAAWDLYRTGSPPKQICVQVGLTRSQLETLVREGYAPKKQPSFESRIIEERKAIRAEAIEAAKEVSTRGVEVIGQAMRNSQAATLLVKRVLESVNDRLEEGEAIRDALPNRHELDVLRVLRRYCDMGPVVAAYKALYETPPSQRVGNPAVGVANLDMPKLPADVALPAALALLEEVMGPGASSQLMDDSIRELSQWTPEQLAHYAETGEEPALDDVIDVSEASGPAAP